jgi:hypothetical protein
METSKKSKSIWVAALQAAGYLSWGCLVAYTSAVLLFPGEVITKGLSRAFYQSIPHLSLNISGLRAGMAALKADSAEIALADRPEAPLFHSTDIRISPVMPGISKPLWRAAIAGKSGRGGYLGTIDWEADAITLDATAGQCRFSLPAPIFGIRAINVLDGRLILVLQGSTVRVKRLDAVTDAGRIVASGAVRLPSNPDDTGNIRISGTLRLAKTGSAPENGTGNPPYRAAFSLSGTLARPQLKISDI